jgi:hypothetical protein
MFRQSFILLFGTQIWAYGPRRAGGPGTLHPRVSVSKFSASDPVSVAPALNTRTSAYQSRKRPKTGVYSRISVMLQLRLLRTQSKRVCKYDFTYVETSKHAQVCRMQRVCSKQTGSLTALYSVLISLPQPRSVVRCTYDGCGKTPSPMPQSWKMAPTTFSNLYRIEQTEVRWKAKMKAVLLSQTDAESALK